MTNNRILSILCVVSMTVTCLNLLGEEALAGGFARTCRNLKLTSPGNGKDIILNANCKDGGGRFRPSRLNLNNGIGNADGRLVPKSKGFRGSCAVPLALNGTIYRVNCTSKERLDIPTSIDLNKIISNQDGRLKFD